MDLNKVMIIGRLTRDPEMRTTPSGATVVNFSLATNRAYTTTTGEKREEVEYHNIVAWGKLAQIISQYVTKGRRIYIEGRLQTRSWDDQNGIKHYKTETVAENMIMLDSRTPSDAGQSSYAKDDASGGEKIPTISADAPANSLTEADPGDIEEEEVRIEDIPF